MSPCVMVSLKRIACAMVWSTVILPCCKRMQFPYETTWGRGRLCTLATWRQGGGGRACDCEIALDRHVDGGVFRPVDGGWGMCDAGMHTSISMRGVRGTVSLPPPPARWHSGP